MEYSIQARGLTKTYGAKCAVDDLTLDIKDGELFALLGINGAGKTTTIKMLSGLTLPTSGDATLLGESIISDPAHAKKHNGVSPQETAVARNLTVLENLALMARIYGANEKTSLEKARSAAKQLGLTEVANAKAKTLSGGMQRRLSIGMALISNPKILFLDEPTLGLDVIARRELWAVVRGLKGRVTILLTTHYLEEVEALSDRVGIMAHGRLNAVGTVAELIAQTGARNFEDAFIALATDTEEIA
ncbi:MAG: ABC transporter ATP-binding protein [Eubacteriales bacterium]|jgi:ABC-2 type transport system ATP-binding protein|nr:ABC transporter ATP-binding protein [Eubacteriales bacterium]